MRARHLLLASFAAPLFFLSSPARAEEGVVVETDLPPPPPPKRQEAVAPTPAPYHRTTHGTAGAYTDDDDDGDEHGDPSVPRERVGFQMAIRTGYNIPMGNAATGLKMSDTFGGQVPVILDIGGKVHPNIFIGGYLGLGFGGCGNELGSHTSCLSDSLTIGAEILFSILPRGRVNPWVGYGIGLAASAIATDSGSIAFGGYDLGHFMGGVDFRVSKGFGVGPFLDFGVGKYGSIKETVNGIDKTDDLDDKTFHEWLLLGAKFTIFP